MSAQQNKVNIFSRKITKNIFLALFTAVFFFTYFLSTQNSYAAANDCDDPTLCGIGRIRSCSSAGDPSELVFDPTQNGADVMFDISNPVCISVIATSYATVKAAIAAMCYACGLNQYPDLTPSPVRDLYLITQGGIKAANSANDSCAIAVGAASAAMTTALAELGIIYGVAKGVFDNTKLCGGDWYSPDPDKYNISKGKTKSEMEQWIAANPSANLADLNYRQWYYNGVEYSDNPSEGDSCEDPTGSNVKTSGHFPKQKYYLRGTQAGNYNCSRYDLSLSNVTAAKNPNATDADYKTAYDCCRKRSQQYACIDYHTSASVGSLSNNDGVFCESGSKCTIEGITFSAAPINSRDSRLICVQSYSLCPYNFTIGKGGSTICDYYQDGIKGSNGKYTYITPDDIAKATDPDNPTSDCNNKSEIRNSDCTYNEKAGQCKNYCQYLTHCTVVGASTYEYKSDLSSPYFSSACYNFVGDSRNLTSFNSGIILGSQKHFSAPIAQCVKETLENVFYNRAGHSQCATNTEYPSADGTCSSGNYIQSGSFTYKKGNTVKETSFFNGLQNSLQDTVKMVLTISIMFFGLKILIGSNMTELKKSDIIMYIIKIGLVMYFATGDAWQTMFFDGVYNSSTVFSKMVFHIESTMPDSKKDGCQFDDATLGIANEYPSGKSYLSIWDTLDCKIARYLGYGPPATSIANIASLIFAGLFTGPYGIYFVIGLMFFGFFFISMTIRALHIFLTSAMSIIIMIYISPIIIPTALFSKTADIFKSWLSNLISFCLQPIILFAYIAIFIVVFDSTMIGSATFSGNPPNKTISCASVCKDDAGNMVNGDTTCSLPGHEWVGGLCKDSAGNVVYDEDPNCTGAGHTLIGATCKDASGNNVGGDPDCSEPGHTMIDPLTDSIACLVNINDYSKINFLETIGISLPSLKNLFASNVKEKILTIIKAAFVMYVLYQFMDQIPSITEQLIGGTSLPSGKSSGMETSGMDMMKSVGGIAESIRERVTRGAIKYGKDSYKTISDTNQRARKSGEKKADDAPSGSNDIGSTGGSGSNGGGSSGGEGESE